MPRGSPSQDEIDAGALLAAVLDGTYEALDVTGAADRTPDLAIQTKAGQRIIVEVTGAVNERRRRRNQAAYKREWTDPRLNRDWVVVLRDEATPRFEAVIPELATHLAILERFDQMYAGINWLHVLWPIDPQFPLPQSGSELDIARRGLRDLCVELARSPNATDRSGGGQITLHFVVPSGVDHVGLTELIQECISRKSPKLAAVTGDARHVFIWMDESEPRAFLAAVTLEQRMPVPELPPHVDAVWVATRHFPAFDSTRVGGVQIQRLIRITTQTGWRTIPLGAGRNDRWSAAES